MSDRMPPGKVPPPGPVPPRKGKAGKPVTPAGAPSGPPMGKVPPPRVPPKRSSGISGWRLGAISAIVATLVIAGAAWLMRGDSPAPSEVAQLPTGTPTDVFDLEGSAPVETALPTPTFPPEDTPTTGPTQPAGVCAPLCLARLPSGDGVDAFLGEFGAKPTYEHGDQTWISVDNRMLAQLESEGREFALVEGVTNDSRLYVVRLPDGVDRSAIDGLGTVVDGVENQFIVDIPGGPPYVLDLAEQGISVEKLPPLLPVIAQTGDKPDITDPGLVAESISVGQLKQRVTDLQSMGAPEGQLGTREYSQPGNVDAAEYLYRRLASYGLNVWYEDFIADNGRLLLNVVGEIPGRDPSKIYLMTAHFDSIADDTRDPTLAPGALDNATGDSVLLEVARALSGYTLEHPVHFAFFNGEEYALQGAHAFAHHATTVESRPYAGAYNVDSVGASLEQNQLYVNATQSSSYLSSLLVDINDRYGLGIAVWPSMSDKIKADDTELNNFGIPAVMVAAVLYGDPLINQSKDVIGNVDMWYLQAVGQLLAIAMSTLVMPGG